jgi:4-diphosphocytidyl-2-C-methyl-D-erythritol kinase
LYVARATNIDGFRASLVSSNKLTLPSFAKINLSLRVTGRRADGYHEIRTLLQTITLRDTLTFESEAETSRAAGLEITCDDPTIPTDERNLVYKAALALRRHYKKDAGARIHLEKRIPTAAV